MKKINKKKELFLSLNSFAKNDDPTIINATYIILDFEVNHNNVLVDKEVAMELGSSIINKPICAKYVPVSEPNTLTDNFTGHEANITMNKYGKKTITTDTIPIGVFTTNGYLMTINVDGEDKEVMAADAVLWCTRFSDACDLLVEWHSRGINIGTSCEFLYSNFTFQDGVEHIHSPIWFEGNCQLASELRGNQDVVLPAYDSSKLLSFNEVNQLNKMVAQAFIQNKNQKVSEGEEMKFKKLFELSHEDIRSKIYQVLDPTLTEGTYSWIQDVYDDRFIVELAGDESYKMYQYNYSVANDIVTIDLESKIEVIEKKQWVLIDAVQALQTQMNEAVTKTGELEAQVGELQVSLNSEKEAKTALEVKLNEVSINAEKLSTEKEEVSQKFNEATEKLTTLHAEVETLKPLVAQFNEIELNKSLNEKQEFYKAKFSGLSALEKFDSIEVQELISKTIVQDDEGSIALTKLNSILVDLVQVQSQTIDKKDKFNDFYVRELSSKMENLIPTANNFDSKYT